MRELLEQQRALGFPAFAGADATILIPLREGVVNALLRQAISGRGVAKGVTVQILANNRLGVDVAIDKWPLPKQIHVDCVLAPNTNFLVDPRLLIMYNIPGLVGMLAKPALPMLAGMIGNFVSISDNRAFVDIKELLTKRNLGDLLPYVRSLAISSERGVMFLTLNLHINEKASQNA